MLYIQLSLCCIQIVVVHSEGTYKKYKAYVDKKNLDDLQSRWIGDTFWLAQNLLLNLEQKPEFRAKLLHVYFQYTSKVHVHPALVNRAATYRLMDSMDILLFSIHGK